MKFEIDKNRIPNHIGIIMDGNGRYAQRKGLPRTFGHKAGAENLRTITEFARNTGVKNMTVYAFSTENWKRPSAEVSGIMKLLAFYLGDWKNQLGDSDLRIRVIGDLTGFDPSLVKMIDFVEKQTECQEGITLNIALGYGGRNEIVQATQKLAKLCVEGKIKPEEIDEKMLSENMYANYVDDPELIIRTGGEIRTSNFLLWQSAYSEYYFTDVLWPEFSPDDLLEAIWTYQNRDRRYGGLNNKESE